MGCADRKHGISRYFCIPDLTKRFGHNGELDYAGCDKREIWLIRKCDTCNKIFIIEARFAWHLPKHMYNKIPIHRQLVHPALKNRYFDHYYTVLC